MQTDLRRWMTVAQQMVLCEAQPRRKDDPLVVEWVEDAYARPDANRLYLHGSRHLFERFADPDTSIGKLIHFTKLTGENWPKGNPLQAEYYGPILYLVTIRAKKPFRPLDDPEAKDILSETLRGVYDYEGKVRWGRIDYQDQHLVVPTAVAAGYDLFRIYECSVCGDSIGVARGNIVTIVDRYPQDGKKDASLFRAAQISGLV